MSTVQTLNTLWSCMVEHSYMYTTFLLMKDIDGPENVAHTERYVHMYIS